ncbi:MAG: hypothetical protein JWO03_3008 [Bacteroidetes bacterium]|nr:hypothetical protein [Bacteroidota bacterium]
MKIYISDNRYIYEVQEEFQKEYPFLKLEFYRPLNKMQRTILKPQVISYLSPIEAIRKSATEGPFDINENRSIAEIENDLKNIFGLYVEVFRKSGNLWIETTLTHHWSLRQQNLEGMQMSQTQPVS